MTFQDEKTAKADTNWSDKTCESTQWYTPEEILAPTRALFGGRIPLDPATRADNPTGALRFFTPIQDGLRQSWEGDGFFINPPYGKNFKVWTKKIRVEVEKGTKGIGLLPCGARFSTRYWQRDILNDQLTAICFVKGRVPFLRPDGTKATQNNYDSAIYGWNIDPDWFGAVYGIVGSCFAMRKVSCVEDQVEDREASLEA